MRDALGSVQSVLVLGGNSDIALAIVDRLVASRCQRVVLGVRDPGTASGSVTRFRAAGAQTVEVVRFDALDPASHAGVIAEAVDLVGDLDMVILAAGILDGHHEIDTDPLLAARVIDTNFVGSVSAGLAAAVRLREQGHGTILAISSVAGVRARAENMIYASSKAGMDAFCQALGDALAGTGARCVIVRPGFVHTQLTDGMKPAPFATTPDKIADTVISGLRRNKQLIWAPAIMMPMFLTLRHLPRVLWRRVSAA